MGARGNMTTFVEEYDKNYHSSRTWGNMTIGLGEYDNKSFKTDT